jgi:tetratricopeptide (TPR) repeat protein
LTLHPFCGYIRRIKGAAMPGTWNETDSSSLARELLSGEALPEYARVAEDLRRAGDPETAARVCVVGITHRPKDVSGRMVFARCCYDLRDAEATIEAAMNVLAIDPDNVPALRMLGDLSLEAGDKQNASLYYARVLELDPLNDEMRLHAESVIAGFSPDATAARAETPVEEHARPAEVLVPQATVELVDEHKPQQMSGFDLTEVTDLESHPETKAQVETEPAYDELDIEHTVVSAPTGEMPESEWKPLAREMDLDQVVSTPVPVIEEKPSAFSTETDLEAKMSEPVAGERSPHFDEPRDLDEALSKSTPIPGHKEPESETFQFAEASTSERDLDASPPVERQPVRAPEKQRSPFAPRGSSENFSATGLTTEEILDKRLGTTEGVVFERTPPRPSEPEAVVTPQPLPTEPPPATTDAAPPPPEPPDPSAIVAKLRALEQRRKDDETESVPDDSIKAKRLSFTGRIRTEVPGGPIESELEGTDIELGSAAQVIPDGTRGLDIEATEPVVSEKAGEELEITGNEPPETLEGEGESVEEVGTTAPEQPAGGDVSTGSLAELYASQGHYEKALEMYRELLIKDPSNIEIIERMNQLSQQLAESEGDG